MRQVSSRGALSAPCYWFCHLKSKLRLFDGSAQLKISHLLFNPWQAACWPILHGDEFPIWDRPMASRPVAAVVRASRQGALQKSRTALTWSVYMPLGEQRHAAHCIGEVKVVVALHCLARSTRTRGSGKHGRVGSALLGNHLPHWLIQSTERRIGSIHVGWKAVEASVGPSRAELMACDVSRREAWLRMEIALAYLVRSCKIRATSDPCSPAGSCLYACVESARTTIRLLPMLWKVYELRVQTHRAE